MKINIAHNRKLLNIGKWMIALIAFAYLAIQLWQVPKLYLQAPDLTLLLVACLLMFINIGLEIVKWRLSIQLFEPQSLKHNIQSVLIGITLGIITPFQIGDVVGKISYVTQLSKEKALMVAMAGGFAQASISLSFGVLGLAFWLHQIYFFNLTILLSIAILISVLVFCCYTYLGYIIPLLFHIESAVVVIAKQFTPKKLLMIIALALVRYIVFSTQLLLLLKAFGIMLPILVLLICVCAVFFIQSFVPSFVVADISVRGAAIMLIFSPYGVNIAAVLAASYILWFTNRIIPGTMGWLLLLRYNPAHSLK